MVLHHLCMNKLMTDAISAAQTVADAMPHQSMKLPHYAADLHPFCCSALRISLHSVPRLRHALLRHALGAITETLCCLLNLTPACSTQRQPDHLMRRRLMSESDSPMREALRYSQREFLPGKKNST
jgi:hypothetical protein